MKGKLKSPYWIVTILILIIFCINAFCHFVLEDIVGNVWRTAIQDSTLMLVFYFLNRRYLKVTASLYSKEIPFKKQFLAALPVVLLVCSYLSADILGFQTEHLMPALVTGLFAGIVEEYLLRGIILGYLMQKQSLTRGRIWLALLVSAVLFGLIHLLNISSQPLTTTLLQILNAAIFGFLVGAVYIRTKSLIWLILEHVLYDFSLMLLAGTNAVIIIAIGVLLQWLLAIPLTLFLLRRKKLAEIYDLTL